MHLDDCQYSETIPEIRLNKQMNSCAIFFTQFALCTEIWDIKATTSLLIDTEDRDEK
jgi:hypothetical protein